MADSPDPARELPRAPSPEDAAGAAQMIRGLVGEIESGTMSAPPSFVDRLDGAAVALDAVAGTPVAEGDR